MWRVRSIAAIVFTAVALVASAYAGARSDHAPADADADADADPRGALASQLTDEAAALDRARAMVTDKLVSVDAMRARRLAAAYRLLRATPAQRDPDGLGTARRRAAARLLIERDVAERQMLAAELVHLRDATTRTAGEAARIAGLVLPTGLARPAAGTIVRHFGMILHDRSNATLSRRGIDFEVDAHAKVVAPAAGTVRYAGPIRSLGTGLILDHGTYLTVVAKLGDPTVPVGAVVARGDRLGRASQHRVYLEVRVKLGAGGLPVDPEPLFESQPQSPTQHRRGSR